MSAAKYQNIHEQRIWQKAFALKRSFKQMPIDKQDNIRKQIIAYFNDEKSYVGIEPHKFAPF